MASDRLSGTYFAITFDCADTLLQLDPSRTMIFRDAAADLGLTLTLQDIERAYDIVDFAIRMRSSELKSESAKLDFYYLINLSLCDVLGIRQSFSLLHPRLIAEFRRRKQWRPFPDVTDTLRELAKRASLYVLANWDNTLGTVLQNTGLGQFFRDAWPSATLGAEKPARVCFDAFLARTSLDPSTTLYVGNEYVADVVGARAVGLTPVLVDRRCKMLAADCVRVSTMTQLIGTIRPYLSDVTSVQDAEDNTQDSC